jgi:Ni,Fe-hydrogenase I large subunit
MVFPRGLWNGVTQREQALDLGDIREDSAHAWLDDIGGPRHPADGQTQPLLENPTPIPGTKPHAWPARCWKPAPLRVS